MTNNTLPEIEQNYALDTVVSKKGNVSLWPLLRQRFYFDNLSKTVAFNPNKRTRKKLLLLRNLFYGFFQIFKIFSYENYCFENTNKRVWLDEKWYDIYFDSWADKWGQDKCLFIEFAAQGHYPRKKVHSKNIISDLPFKLMAWWFSKKIKSDHQGQEVLLALNNSLNLQFNVEKELRTQLGEYYFYRWFFNRCKKIKTVFVLSSFSKVALVMAARSLKIPVVEAQHGFIGLQHPFYATHFPFYEAYPDVLLSFGDYEKKYAKKNVFRSEQIFSIGSLHLQLEKKKPIPKPLQRMRKEFDYIVCLTMQDIKEKEQLAMTKPLAQSGQNVLFVICPKNKQIDYSEYTAHSNYLVSEYPIYDILKISDVNITLFSTTAVEGEFLGATTIFYNAGGFSKSYFDTNALGNLVLEEAEFLSLEHITQAKKTQTPYFVEDYFKNVAQLELKKFLS